MKVSEVLDIETVNSRVVYENRWMRVREDQIRRRDGSDGIYGVVEKPDFVVIAPVEDDGRIHLVQQFRYPIGARYWELPQGTWELEPESDPLVLARAELREETGLEASELTCAGKLFPGYGFATQAFHIFLAKGLRQNAPAPELEEQDLISRTFPLEILDCMIRDGEIKDATTVAALGLLRLKGLL
jgi:ADP-ribose diphosphatase